MRVPIELSIMVRMGSVIQVVSVVDQNGVDSLIMMVRVQIGIDDVSNGAYWYQS